MPKRAPPPLKDGASEGRVKHFCDPPLAYIRTRRMVTRNLLAVANLVIVVLTCVIAKKNHNEYDTRDTAHTQHFVHRAALLI